MLYLFTATLALYKMNREDVIGRTVDEIFPPPLAAILNGHLAEALRKNLLRRKAQSRARKNPAPQAGAKECR